MLKEKILKLREKISFKNLKKRDFKKRAKLFSVLLILIMIGLVLPSNFAHAGVSSWVLENAIYPVIYIIFLVLFEIANIIAWLGATILNWTLNPKIMNEIFANKAIYEGWTLIRDISNLLFLLIMLLVAFGTILQSEKYNIKNSLSKLIIAIFLINFSFPIAGVIVDFGNILMYGILVWRCPSESATCFQDFYKGLMDVIEGFKEDYTLANLFSSGTSSLQMSIGLGVATIYTYMYGFILLAMAGFLLVRTVALSLLLILAPFAYFGEVMPGMENLGKKWWDNIWSYTLFGPIFALMFFISGKLADNILKVTAPSMENSDLGIYEPLVAQITVDILPLLFLLAIIPITKSLGLAGTETIMKNTTGLGESLGKGAASVASDSWGRFVARGAGMQGGKSLGSKVYAGVRRGMSSFSPTAIKNAYKAKQANDAHDYDVATGRARNKFEAVADPLGAGKDKYKRMTDPNYKSNRRDYQKEAEKKKAMESWKEEGVDNSTDAIDSLARGKKLGESEEKLSVKVKFIAAEGGIDDVLERSTYKDATGAQVKYGKGAAGLKKYIDDTFTHFSEEEKSKLFSNIAKSETSKNGNTAYEGLGKSSFNTTLGRTEYTTTDMTTGAGIRYQEDEQVKAANKKDVKDLKKGSFINVSDLTSQAGKRILADMKGTRADRIKTMDRERVESINKALNKEFGSIGGLGTAIGLLAPTDPKKIFLADLQKTWSRIKTDHPDLP